MAIPPPGSLASTAPEGSSKEPPYATPSFEKESFFARIVRVAGNQLRAVGVFFSRLREYIASGFSSAVKSVRNFVNFKADIKAKQEELKGRLGDHLFEWSQEIANALPYDWMLQHVISQSTEAGSFTQKMLSSVLSYQRLSYFADFPLLIMHVVERTCSMATVDFEKIQKNNQEFLGKYLNLRGLAKTADLSVAQEPFLPPLLEAIRACFTDIPTLSDIAQPVDDKGDAAMLEQVYNPLTEYITKKLLAFLCPKGAQDLPVRVYRETIFKAIQQGILLNSRDAFDALLTSMEEMKESLAGYLEKKEISPSKMVQDFATRASLDISSFLELFGIHTEAETIFTRLLTLEAYALLPVLAAKCTSQELFLLALTLIARSVDSLCEQIKASNS